MTSNTTAPPKPKLDAYGRPVLTTAEIQRISRMRHYRKSSVKAVCSILPQAKSGAES